MTAKELGKRLFEIHTHAVIHGDGESCMVYTEKDILELLKDLGHPDPDWDWYKDDPKMRLLHDSEIKEEE